MAVKNLSQRDMQKFLGGSYTLMCSKTKKFHFVAFRMKDEASFIPAVSPASKKGEISPS